MKTQRRFIIIAAVLALALAACGGSTGGGSDDTTTTSTQGIHGDVVNGAAVYASTCQTCHGPNQEGVEGLGKPLAPSAFVDANSEDELVAFVLVGRPASHPANTQGVDMPPKGGNPSLDDQDIHDVVAYLKSLN